MTLVFTADTLPNVTWLFNDEIIELVDNTGFNVIGPFEISEDPNRYKVYTCVQYVYIHTVIHWVVLPVGSGQLEIFRPSFKNNVIHVHVADNFY